MSVTDERRVDFGSIMRLSSAYAQAKILHSAVELGLFELLAKGPADAQEITAGLGCSPRFMRDFLQAAAALGLLVREGSRYRNAPGVDELLVPGGPGYLGGRIVVASQRHYTAWGQLTTVLREGKPPAKAGADAFDGLYADPVRARGFLAHMDANNALVGPQLADQVDWSGHRSFVDVGGARGNVAAALVKAHPHLTGGVFDLPGVRPYFDELMAELGTAETVRFHAGDFFTTPMPATDVVILGHVLHDWTVDKRQELLVRAFDAVRPGGAVVVYDQMLDEEQPDLRSLIGSINVGLMTGGSEYTVADCRQWIEKAGLRFDYARRLPKGNDTVLVARREPAAG